MGIDGAPLHRLMVAEFPAGANLKPGTADFASPSPASLQYAKRARQLSSCRALGRSVLRFISREPFSVAGIAFRTTGSLAPLAQRSRFRQQSVCTQAQGTWGSKSR